MSNEYIINEIPYSLSYSVIKSLITQLFVDYKINDVRILQNDSPFYFDASRFLRNKYAL